MGQTGNDRFQGVLPAAQYFRISGVDLGLNVTVRRGGEIRVSVRGPDDKPIEGYDSAAIEGDGLDLAVRWPSHRDLGSARAKGDIRLEFKLKDASLYSFTVR